MLKFFSRLEKTRSFVLLLFAVIMVVSLIVFYAPTPDNARSNLAGNRETIAKVGDETVTAGELYTQKQSLAQLYGTRLPASGFLLDAMIRDRIVRQEAEKLGLTATDQEVAAEIRRQFDTGDGKPLDQKRYEQIAAERYGGVKAYEQSVRDDLSGQKLQAFVTSGVSVSEEEVLNDFRRRNTKFDLSYVPVSVAEAAKTINPSDEQLRSYFDQNKANYRITLPQKKIRYVFINTAKIGEKLSIPDAEIQAEYDKLPADRKQAGVEGQQIVLKIPNPQEKTQVQARAAELVERARKEGGKISAEAFAELARGFSQDPATAQNGGNLRGLVRPNPNNPSDPYQQILQMQPGEVTDPIDYGGNYYILRRGNPVAKTFEDSTLR